MEYLVHYPTIDSSLKPLKFKKNYLLQVISNVVKSVEKIKEKKKVNTNKRKIGLVDISFIGRKHTWYESVGQPKVESIELFYSRNVSNQCPFILKERSIHWGQTFYVHIYIYIYIYIASLMT